MARIAILTTEYEPFRGGVATFVHDVAMAGAELGHDISVFAPDYLAEQDIPLPPGVTVRRYHAGAYSPRWYPAYLRASYAALREGYDQVLAADIGFLECCGPVFGLARQPFDAFVHGSEINRSRHSTKGRLLTPFHLFSRPRRIFANSEFTRNLLLENFPDVDSSKAIVALLGVGAEWFAPTDPGMIRSRLQLNDDRIIACVGRVTPRKGQLTLLRALAAKGLDRPGLSVVIAGQYSARDIGFASELRAESAKLQHIRTVFADDLTDEEVRSLYAAADVFCLPGSGQTSAVEGFGLVYLEAAAQGTPSVAGAARGVPEVISHGETGLLVAADEPMELAVALTTLLDDPAKRLLMGEAARLRAGKFTWRRCAETVFGSR